MTKLKAMFPAILTGVLVGEDMAINAGRPPIGQAAAPKPRRAAKAAARARLPDWNADHNADIGDLHVHTRLSNGAYRFTKGETIGHTAGLQVR